jgi:hypothetical protein
MALLIAPEVRAARTTPPTDPAKQQQEDAEAAKKAEAESRRDAADRLIALRRLISAEERGMATTGLADRTDELLLDLVEGKLPTSEFNSQIKKIDSELVSTRRKTVHARAQGTARWEACLGEIHSFGTGLAVLLSLGSLALSLFLYLRRRDVVEQTLRDAGLL